MMFVDEVDVNGLRFRVHPVYDQYAASECGKIVNVDKKNILLGNPIDTNYLKSTVRTKNTGKRKCVYLHRFIYECYHGIIPDGLVIDHINDAKIDNRLCNLQLVTQQQNNQKSAKYMSKDHHQDKWLLLM